MQQNDSLADGYTHARCTEHCRTSEKLTHAAVAADDFVKQPVSAEARKVLAGAARAEEVLPWLHSIAAEVAAKDEATKEQKAERKKEVRLPLRTSII